jgi:hypothetical protein
MTYEQLQCRTIVAPNALEETSVTDAEIATPVKSAFRVQ